MEIPPENGISIPAEKRRILVVDDEATLRLGISYTLTCEDTEIDLAEHGKEAIEKLRAQSYDLMLIDLRMPGMDGIEVIETMRAGGNLVPVILCSAEFTPGACLRAVRCGVVDFLGKPASPKQIRLAVDFVTRPPEDAFSLAMTSARSGDFPQALRFLESGGAMNFVSQAWSKVFEEIGTGSDRDDDSARTISEFDFAALAHNAAGGA